MKALEILSLTKRYGSARGVDDLSFDVERGEVFGYLGPNGSGKTTTIRCIMGLLRATRGEVRVMGSRVAPGRAVEHARIGYLPGEFRIWSDLAARRSLGVLAAIGGDGARERLDDEWTAGSTLDDLLLFQIAVGLADGHRIDSEL